MSQIEDLINELCPDGVTKSKLGELVHIRDNERIPISKDKRVPGSIPYYGANGIQGYVADYIFEGTFLLVGEDGSVINKDGSPILNWATGKIWVNNHAHVLAELPDRALLRYLFFALSSSDVTKIVRGTPPKINQENLRDIVIPIPPIEVQQEIVRILDTFTELDAELEAELEARKKQYEHYRDSILSFNDDKSVAWKPLGELGTFTRGKGLPKEQLVQAGLPAIHYGQLYTSYNTWTESTVSRVAEEDADSTGEALPGDLLMPMSDVTPLNVGKAVAWVGDYPIRVGGDVLVFRHQLDPKYLSLYFETGVFQNQKIKMVTGATVRHISAKSLSRIQIPVPTVEKQIIIVGQLEALHHLIFSHLPAEIEARRKQYEHYRDKLINFKELAS